MPYHGEDQRYVITSPNVEFKKKKKLQLGDVTDSTVMNGTEPYYGSDRTI